MNIAYGQKRAGTTREINSDGASVSTALNTIVREDQTIIGISISAENLPKIEKKRAIDPMAVLQIPVEGKYMEVARTEVVWNSTSPNFISSFQANYIAQSAQPIRIVFLDCNGKSNDVLGYKSLGFIETDVHEIHSSIGKELKIKLKSNIDPNNKSTVTLISEQVKNCSEVAVIKFEVKKVRKMRTFSRNNPYIMVSKIADCGKPIPVYRSETIPKCFQCTFNGFEAPLQALCGGDICRHIAITVVDNHHSKEDVPIGSFKTSLEELMNSINKSFKFMDAKNQECGEVIIREAYTYQNPTFTDYLRAGININMITAIDFTGSNGTPKYKHSLHHISDQLNVYEKCISACGSVLCPYDSDQKFPVFGFGGFINGRTEHCIPLTFTDDPNVDGLGGILQAYQNAFKKIELSGPTYFAPVIRRSYEIAKEAFEKNKTYTILLIITDGVLNDYKETSNAIVDASEGPLSIVIVGVGNADFTQMVKLDGDDSILANAKGKKCTRDIVQFTRFLDNTDSNVSLSTALLSEIPEQVIEFCNMKGLKPKID